MAILCAKYMYEFSVVRHFGPRIGRSEDLFLISRAICISWNKTAVIGLASMISICLCSKGYN